MIQKLTGSAPIHSSSKDEWGWGRSGEYSTPKGYKVLQKSQTTFMPSLGSIDAGTWKLVWNSPDVLEVNFFTWTVMHEKVLTRENLLKRGFLGPYRCCFCLQNAESSAHIFVGCNFAHEVLANSMHGFPSYAPIHSDPVILFKNWQSRYPGSTISPAWRKIWQAIPKFVWWKIWLARNDLIFNSKKSNPAMVALKANAFLLEVVGNPQLEEIKLEAGHKWLGVRQENKAQLGASKLVIKPY